MLTIDEVAEGLYHYVIENGGSAEGYSVVIQPDSGVFDVREWNLPFSFPTEAQLQHHYIESAKKKKINEFHTLGIGDLAAALPEGQDELLAILNAHIIAISNALGISPDARLLEVDERQQHAFSKKNDITAVNIGTDTTFEQAKAQLNAITWE